MRPTLPAPPDSTVLISTYFALVRLLRVALPHCDAFPAGSFFVKVRPSRRAQSTWRHGCRVHTAAGWRMEEEHGEAYTWPSGGHGRLWLCPSVAVACNQLLENPNP